MFLNQTSKSVNEIGQSKWNRIGSFDVNDN